MIAPRAGSPTWRTGSRKNLNFTLWLHTHREKGLGGIGMEGWRDGGLVLVRDVPLCPVTGS